MVSQHTFGEPWNEPNPNRVRVSHPAMVMYGHPDLDKAHEFAMKFGLQEVGRSEDGNSISYAGYGTQPVCYVTKKTDAPKHLGYFFEASSEEDLEKAAKVPGAGPITPLDLPGGGKAVTITDPSGCLFGVVYGVQKKSSGAPTDDLLPVNYPADANSDQAKKPRKGKFQRLDYGAVPIHKLGHSGFWTKDLNESARFYIKHFNFKPSDFMLNEKNEAQLIFCHVDLGQEYSDHHSLILGQAFGPIPVGPHHAAFEVDNIDHQFVAHEYLKEQGYKEFWGVGRHIEGSQVFDYWWDVDGFLVEHYADGDLVNEQNPVNWVAPRKKNNNWGPAFPSMP